MKELFFFGKAFKSSKFLATAFAAGAVSGLVGYHQQRVHCANRKKHSLIQINAKLLIPGRGDPIKDGTVLINGKTILYAGSGDSCDVRIDDYNVEQIIDAPVVMPGMWDCHVHFIGDSDTPKGSLFDSLLKDHIFFLYLK